MALQRSFELGYRDLGRLHLLSVGTTMTQSAFSGDQQRHLGAFGWLRKDLRLLRHTMQGQMAHVEHLSRSLLTDPTTYARIDIQQTDEQSEQLALDNASPRATKLLYGLYEATVNNPNMNVGRIRREWIG